MKKIFLVLGVLIMSFGISSCELFDDVLNCADNLDGVLALNCQVIVVENGVASNNYPISITYTKHDCDGSEKAFPLKSDNPTGMVASAYWKFNMKNNNDYITLEVYSDGKYSFQKRVTETRTYDINTTASECSEIIYLYYSVEY